MMSGHGANPVFFNKKEIGRLDVQNTHYPHPTALKVDAINVSHLQRRQTFLPTILLKVTLLHGCFSHGAKRHKVDIPQNKGKSRPSLEYYDIKKRQNTAKNYWFF